MMHTAYTSTALCFRCCYAFVSGLAKPVWMSGSNALEDFIAHWCAQEGSKLANAQNLINGSCALTGLPALHRGNEVDPCDNCVLEHMGFQKNGDGTTGFGRFEANRKASFTLETGQRSKSDETAADGDQVDRSLLGQTVEVRTNRGSTGFPYGLDAT